MTDLTKKGRELAEWFEQHQDPTSPTEWDAKQAALVRELVARAEALEWIADRPFLFVGDADLLKDCPEILRQMLKEKS